LFFSFSFLDFHYSFIIYPRLFLFSAPCIVSYFKFRKFIFPIDFLKIGNRFFKTEDGKNNKNNKKENLRKYNSEVHLLTLRYLIDVEINIITLLEGERKVDEPIHKEEFFKLLEMKSLIKAVNVIQELMR